MYAPHEGTTRQSSRREGLRSSPDAIHRQQRHSVTPSAVPFLLRGMHNLFLPSPRECEDQMNQQLSDSKRSGTTGLTYRRCLCLSGIVPLLDSRMYHSAIQ